jgi:hypothetical protein
MPFHGSAPVAGTRDVLEQGSFVAVSGGHRWEELAPFAPRPRNSARRARFAKGTEGSDTASPAWREPPAGGRSASGERFAVAIVAQPRNRASVARGAKWPAAENAAAPETPHQTGARPEEET